MAKSPFISSRSLSEGGEIAPSKARSNSKLADSESLRCRVSAGSIGLFRDARPSTGESAVKRGTLPLFGDAQCGGGVPGVRDNALRDAAAFGDNGVDGLARALALSRQRLEAGS
eukprot:2677194-Pleurochrysis_carterae.AAC.2